MAVKPEDRLSVGDYVTFKGDGHQVVYKVLLINYIDNKMTVRIIHPLVLKEGTDKEPSFSINSVKLKDFQKLDRKVVKVLYGI